MPCVGQGRSVWEALANSDISSEHTGERQGECDLLLAFSPGECLRIPQHGPLIHPPTFKTTGDITKKEHLITNWEPPVNRRAVPTGT